ncbi:LRR receptor-like serine/threonine-protein kinase EFR [Apium graveolens]|uniref:LRR receptor-like serine/threonine-protein kinase EFR n=1 Tax=Apium graveolens TaxID=4045 RepID=UPI003D7C12E8
MFLRFIILFFLLLLATSNIYVFAFSSNDTDHQALRSFKDSIKDDPLGALDSWNNSIHFCQWNGVTCSSRRQRVTALNLSSQQLGGTLSPHIGNLSFLRMINLPKNNFHGSIPNEIGRLFRLQYLSLYSNSFQGVFPVNLSHCVDVRDIDLGSNNLEGELPSDFSSWYEIDRIDLSTNHFTGSIPPSIRNLSSLSFLSLSQNNLQGRIPFDVSHLAKLVFLALSQNRLSGIVPRQLYNNSILTVVSLTQNELEGTLPSDLGFTLPKLQRFHVGVNRFSGPLPPSIVNVSNLVKFDISENNIIGPIPNNLGSLSNIEWLGLSQNPLGENMQPNDWRFFDSLVNCTHIKYLGLDEISLRGQLPNSIVNLSTAMEELYMYGNHIYGSIPNEIGKLVNMTVLSFSGNLLTGSIPESIGTLSKLGVLRLSGNNISGSIPTSMGNITQLNYLYLDNNLLQGSLPKQLFNISNIEELYLYNNKLSGVIPEEIMFSSHCLDLDLSQNLFSDPFPSNIGLLKQLVRLHVSYNKLRGDIPATLGGCLMLEELYMDGNNFQGKIPSSFKALKNLAFLNLSNNNISGSIPSFFDGFHLIFLDLSYNKLGGQVSKTGLFSNISAFSIIGNLELCGGIQALDLPACPESRKKKAFSLRMILILVLVPSGMLLACLALIFYRRRNSKKLNDFIPVLKDSQYPTFSYQDLVLATNGFSPNNLLGEGRYGSVYKAVLEYMDDIVAVKVLKVEVRGANKSFLAECGTLRNIRHRNLIKIITACSSIDHKGNDFKALVFEFMTNGSLDSWLHPSPPHHQGNERNLTLLQRLNIAIDVALGVDYLHHHSHASIIHSDIKPSNILLDEDFVAHIGDFGLARFSLATSDVNEAQISSTGVRGTLGYVPPEYGICGEISAQGDVYSYGILLLEMFTGKRPTESSILMDNDKDLHDYVRKALPQRVMDIVDPRIILDQEEHGSNINQSHSRAPMEVCLASVFEVGILCSGETPQKRIDISDAITLLHVARDKLLQCSE